MVIFHLLGSLWLCLSGYIPLNTFCTFCISSDCNSVYVSSALCLCSGFVLTVTFRPCSAHEPALSLFHQVPFLFCLCSAYVPLVFCHAKIMFRRRRSGYVLALFHPLSVYVLCMFRVCFVCVLSTFQSTFQSTFHRSSVYVSSMLHIHSGYVPLPNLGKMPNISSL